MGAPRGTVEERFWRKVSKSESGCWIWSGYRKHSGHGMMHAKPTPIQAHRVSWEIHNGPVPAGLHVLHKCDVPACVNPAHLYVGTHQDNMRDRDARNHYPRARQSGEANGFSKLCAEDVLSIRILYLGGEAKRSLARLFGVSSTHIRRIVRGESWSAPTASKAHGKA